MIFYIGRPPFFGSVLSLSTGPFISSPKFTGGGLGFFASLVVLLISPQAGVFFSQHLSLSFRCCFFRSVSSLLSFKGGTPSISPPPLPRSTRPRGYFGHPSKPFCEVREALTARFFVLPSPALSIPWMSRSSSEINTVFPPLRDLGGARWCLRGWSGERSLLKAWEPSMSKGHPFSLCALFLPTRFLRSCFSRQRGSVCLPL